jgi:polysaccharide biosynthesis transport protein
MELMEYLTPLRKWWWLILASTLVAAGSSFLAGRNEPVLYQSRTTLMIGRAIDDPNPTTNVFWLSQQLAQTYADIARRQPVRNATMDALGLTWLPQYTSRAVPNSQLLEITVTDSVPERAQAVANELARQLILQSPTSSQQEQGDRQQFIDQQLDDLEANIKETQAEIRARQDEIGQMFSARQIADTQAQIASLQAKLATLQSNYAGLLANTQRGAINTLGVIEAAGLPRTPVGAGQLSNILLAAAIGFVLAAGAAYLMEYLDDTIKTPDDIDCLVELPVLAGIARIKPDKGQSQLVALEQPRSPIAEAFRVLRTGIDFSLIDSPDGATLLVTSATPSEGKSVTAANLAIVMAQAGHKTLLVDTDLRRPVQHKLFKLANSYGLTSLLLNYNANASAAELGALLAEMVPASPLPELHVLTSGPLPPNPSELLGSARMKALLAALAGQYDFIVFDSPPTLAVTDAVVLSRLVSSVLVVVEANRTRRGQLKQLVQRLKEAKAHLIGASLNRLSPGSEGYGYYYYYRTNYYNAEPAVSENGHRATVNGQQSTANSQQLTVNSQRLTINLEPSTLFRSTIDVRHVTPPRHHGAGGPLPGAGR